MGTIDPGITSNVFVGPGSSNQKKTFSTHFFDLIIVTIEKNIFFWFIEVEPSSN